MKYFRKYRNAFCILLTGLLLVRPALYLQAQMLYLTAPGGVSSDTPSDTVSDGDSASEYSVITGYENMDVLTNLPELRLVQRTSPHNTNDLLEHVFSYYRINAYVQRPDGTTETITLRVNWDCFGYDVFRVDVTTPGSYTEIGRIQLPDEQTVFGEDVPSELTIPVTVYVPDTPVEITYIQELNEDFIFYSSYALEQYHDVSEVTDLLRDTWVCEDANGHEYECPVVLDTSLVDTDTPGLYEINGTFLPPLHCTFPEELEVPSFTLGVSVQAPGEPRLDCMQFSMWYLYFPWIARNMDLDSMKVWLSENDGEWRELCQYDEVYLTESDLSLDPYFLTEGSSYRLQVDYEGGQTGIASFDLDEGIFQFKGYIDGDRDGGDTNGIPPTPIPTQIPTPVPTSAPTAAPTQVPTAAPTAAPTQAPTIAPTQTPSAVSASSTDVVPTLAPEATPGEAPAIAPTEAPSVLPTESPITEPVATATPIPPSMRPEPYLLGSEVMQMLETTGSARFSNQGILLSLPADTIKKLALTDEEQLLVTLKPSGKDGFSLDIMRNGEPISTLNDMQVTLPYAQKNAHSTLVLVDSEGKEVTQGSLSETPGLVTFTLQQTGAFSIQEHVGTELLAPTEADEATFPWTIVIVTSLVLTLSTVLFILYRKRGR